MSFIPPFQGIVDVVNCFCPSADLVNFISNPGSKRADQFTLFCNFDNLGAVNPVDGTRCTYSILVSK
jgi:hypothetical protein